MILEQFWFYVITFFLSGIVFTYPMEKKIHFKRNFMIFAAMEVIYAVVITCIPFSNRIVAEAVFMIIAIILMAPKAVAILRDYEQQKKAGRDPVFAPEKFGIDDYTGAWDKYKNQ